MVEALCGVDLEGHENWEGFLLKGYNRGGGRRQNAPGTVDQWSPKEIRERLVNILCDLSPQLKDLVVREPRLVARVPVAPP